MAAWQVVKLGEVCVIQRGGSPRPIENFITQADNGINWIKIGDVAEGAKYITSTKEKIKPEGTNRSRSVQEGDFLLSNSMSFGRPYILKTSGCIHDGWLVLKYNKDKLLEDYLYHALSADSIYSQFKKLAVGAVVKNLNSEVVKQISIPLPPLPEQRRIAAILDQADALRAKRREALAQLHSLTQSIFLEMFGDPVTNPMGWPITDFKNICSRVTVGIVIQPASYYRDTGVPALRSLNVKPGKIMLDNLVYFSEQDNNNRLKKTQLRAGDLVLVRSGQPGTAAIVPDELAGINAIDILIASPLTDKANPTYLCEFFNSNAGRSLVLSSQRGQIQKHLNVGSLKDAQILLPPTSLQREFASRITAVKSLSAKSIEASEGLNSLFTSLQHRAFRGEL
jgi:type I restriction enzyme S subunit